MKKAVVLLSGGVDSTTTLAVAKAEGYEVYALSFNYGQRHKIELERAAKTAEKFNAEKHLVIDFNLRDIGGSALTDDIDVPKRSAKVSKRESAEGENDLRAYALSRSSTIPVTYVPARNTIFLSFALAWAETLEAGDIFIGANAVDYSGYPDCRPEFIRAFEEMANLATRISVEGKISFRVNAPLINLTKAEILKKGDGLGVDYAMTWSCYDPLKGKGGGAVPCLKCDSCIIREKGFKEAGLDDPLVR